ncbi:MAG: hypothetical protein AAGK23_00405 [Pseudomonadota bacterium]
MTNAAFQTFISGGLLLLVIAVTATGWLLWMQRDAKEDAEMAALDGVTHELRLNLQRMLGELVTLSNGVAYAPGSLMDIHHPQLDAVNQGLVHCDRKALAVMGAAYQELQASKLHLRNHLEAGQDAAVEHEAAVSAAIDGITTLYMWDAHDGCSPRDARSTRSWAVRDWMKANGFGQIVVPGMHLRDEVVERLRTYGMPLTPRPLTHTAHEYWSLRYDRQKDPRAVFGPRRIRKEPKDEGPEFSPLVDAAE